MNKHRFNQILDLAGEEDQIKLRMLYNGFVESMKRYNQSYSAANLRAWKAAERELKDYADQVLADSDDSAPTGSAFQTAKHVLTYLTANGWKVSQSTLYKHVKSGLVPRDRFGRFPLSDVEIYAANHLQRIGGGADPKDAQERDARVRKQLAQAKHWELKSKIDSGLYVPREAFERELVARAVIFKHDLFSFCRAKAAAIVQQVHGDPELVPDLIEFMIEHMEHFLDRYARHPESANLDA